jgi:hypothetical protein
VADKDQSTHLTIYRGRGVRSGKEKNNAQKSGETREGVNLPNVHQHKDAAPQIEASIITDPYRPPVGETAADNPPLIVKGSKVLPARRGGLSCTTRKTIEDSHVETAHCVPDLHNGHY